MKKRTLAQKKSAASLLVAKAVPPAVTKAEAIRSVGTLMMHLVSTHAIRVLRRLDGRKGATTY
jgi:hypothetical protein